jgi:hypothetical protein
MPRSVAENLTVECRVRLPPPANATSGPWRPESFAYRDSLFPRGRPIVHYPIPDFSKVKPKTNSWNTPKTGGQKKEVSGAVTCGMVQM